MTRLRFSLFAVVLAIAGLASGFALNHWLSGKSASPDNNAAMPVPPAGDNPAADAGMVGKARPDFALPDLQDKSRDIAHWNGKVIMLNFWASWCPPCRREMPDFVKLYEHYHTKGFTIVGVAIDTKQNVQDFADPLGVDYPILIGETQAISIAKQYGNRLGILPYTVIIGRDGRIVATHPGELSYAEAEALIKPLL